MTTKCSHGQQPLLQRTRWAAAIGALFGLTMGCETYRAAFNPQGTVDAHMAAQQVATDGTCVPQIGEMRKRFCDDAPSPVDADYLRVAKTQRDGAAMRCTGPKGKEALAEFDLCLSRLPTR